MSEQTKNLLGGNYNPDVLECLANLSNDEVFTPPKVVNQMLDMLPPETWSNPNLKFLDPACKTGVFLREIAKRLIVGLEEQIPNLQQRLDHIFHNQLYGIAITELTALASRRSLYCSKYANGKYSVSKFDNPDGNIRFVPINHTWENGKCKYCGANASQYQRADDLETHAYEFIHTNNPEEIFGMKFDVIIGNPPYQLTTNEENKQARPIYDNFVINAINMHPKYTSFIIPSRWMNGGMGLDKFREMMLGNENIRQLHDYIEASDCFPGIQLTGGVCYFLIDNNYHGLCDIYTHFNGGTSRSRRYLKNQSSDIFIRFNEAVSIIDKIKKKNSTSFSNRVSAIDPFGLSKLDTNSSNFEKKYLTRNKEATNIQIYGNNWNDNNRRYIDRTLVTVNKKQIGKYKVYISKANGAASSKIPYSVLSRPFIGLPDTVCSVTYLVVSCDDKDQAQSICGYMRTKFFRFLVSLMKNTQNTSKTSFSFVPDMDFSKEWKDPDLYSLFNLDNEEIEFIEKMILPMEDK